MSLLHESHIDLTVIKAHSCYDCQKLNGSAFSIDHLADVSDFDITGKENVSSISFKTDTDETQTSDFCGSCGSQIQTKSPKSLTAGIVAMKLGGLDPQFKESWEREGAVQGELSTAR